MNSWTAAGAQQVEADDGGRGGSRWPGRCRFWSGRRGARPACGPALRPVRFRLPRPPARAARRPVIGDALLLQYVLRKRSARSVTELTVRRARQLLAGWAAGQDAAGSRRDGVVRAAVDAGLSKSEVHRLTGIARTTIDRILGAVPAMEADPR